MSTVVLVAVGACTSTPTTISEQPTPSPTTVTTFVALDPGPVLEPVRRADRPIYFVMTDRFWNGDPTNDRGGSDSDDPLVTGFLPTDEGFYQGGDLVGLTARLDYIAGLGIDAIWITPPLVNRAVQGNGTVAGSSAGYHGYWITDFTRIDPHLGGDAAMDSFIAAAHERDIRVYFDIVLNHTADVIGYEEGSTAYRSQNVAPYRDAEGNLLDVTGDPFPLVAEFPYTPTFGSEQDSTVKQPQWLNDPSRYHNRGNSNFRDESSLMGDFFGLDDLFTEDPVVRQGMIAIYNDLIDRFDIDGFRVDTAKHVDDGFWKVFLPGVLDHAAGMGKDDFFIFAEVFDGSPITVSRFSTTLGFSSTLDFPFHFALDGYLRRGDAAVLAKLFDDDDWYTDVDSNAASLVTFVGNHDIGRIGSMLRSLSEDEAVSKESMAFDLLFLTRGIPVVYYGDEQGFTGDGGDKAARQTMFASQVPAYLDDAILGTEAGHADDRLDPAHPLYRHIAALAELRRTHPALNRGAQITRLAKDGVFAFSRVDRQERIEYLVIVNAGPATRVEVPTGSPGRLFGAVYGAEFGLEADAFGVVTVDLERGSTLVLAADSRMPTPSVPFSVETGAVTVPAQRRKIEAKVSDGRYAEVTFAVSVDGGDPILLGTDDAPPYRVYVDGASIPAGDSHQVVVTAVDLTGNIAVARASLTVLSR